MERPSRKGVSRFCQANTSTGPSKKEIDERRLRKLKVYLRSVTYNSCEGLPMFPTLPDLYEDTILPAEFPCDTMKLSGRHHCAPTPFLIACCFNRRYPFNNARKRTGNMRSRSLVKQKNETALSSAGEKKTLPTSANTGNVAIVETSKMTTNEKVDLSMTVAGGKHGVDSRLPSSIDEGVAKKEVSCTVKDHILKPTTCLKKCEGTSVEKTAAKDEGTESDEKISQSTNKEHQEDVNCCSINNSLDEKEGRIAVNRIGFEQLKTDKIAMENTERLCSEQIRAAERKEDLLESKRSSGKKKNANDGLDDFSTNGMSGQVHKDEGLTCAAMSSTKTRPNNLNFMGQNVEDKRKENSEEVISESSNQVKLDVESAKKSPDEGFPDPPQRFKDHDNMMAKVDDSRRSSPRLSNFCSMHKTQFLDKTKCSVHGRESKIAEKVKQKVIENANTRLRSRAMIKQPGHEHRYNKGQQARGK